MTAELETETPIAERICARCRWSRSVDGDQFNGQDRAYCAAPDVRRDDGAPVPCEHQRFAPSSELLHQCGESAIYWTPRA